MEPELVFLHGFTHTGASWDRVKSALPQRYRAHAPDLRGHGSRGPARPVTLAAVLEDLEELAPRRFGLVGYSMGGRIALHAALSPRLGPRIERLVLIGASPGLADPSERAARREADDRLADEVQRMTITQFARRWARTPVLAGLPSVVAAQVHADRLRNDPAALARALRGLGTGALPSLWEQLAMARAPVTLVVGERDAKFRTIAESMAKLLPAAEVVVVTGAGHAVHLEAPEQVAAALS